MWKKSWDTLWSLTEELIFSMIRRRDEIISYWVRSKLNDKDFVKAHLSEWWVEDQKEFEKWIRFCLALMKYETNRFNEKCMNEVWNVQ